MRDRHFARLCRSCRAPLARQEDTCWHCGTDWSAEDEPRTALRLIAGGARTPGADAPEPRIGGAPADHAGAATAARLDADGWINEGGSVASDATGPNASTYCAS